LLQSHTKTVQEISSAIGKAFKSRIMPAIPLTPLRPVKG
jgi:hypothetical protein